jgi:hypothetical protein
VAHLAMPSQSSWQRNARQTFRTVRHSLSAAMTLAHIFLDREVSFN